MFERFTVARMDELLKLKPVTTAGRAFIDEALIKPSRNVQGTTQNVASDIPCPKMWGSAQGESWSAENPFTLQHIFNPDTIGYTNQLPRIWLHYKGRNDRAVRTPYTADCLSINKQRGAVVEEWKPSTDRGKLEVAYPGRYVRDENDNYTSPAIQLQLDPLGLSFVVRFSDEISSAGHRNRTYLFPYLQPSAEYLYLPKLPALLELMGERTSATYAAVIESGADSDVLNWAIAKGRLHVDLDAAVLQSQKHLVQIFTSADTLAAWKLAVRPDGSRPAALLGGESFDLRPGDVFLFDGQRLKVTVAGATALYTTAAGGEHLTIEHQMLISAHRAGKVVLPDRWAKTAMDGRFWRASPGNLERAIGRVGMLERLDAGTEISLADRYSASTVRRWKRLIRDGETKGMSPVECLLDEGEARGFHGSHIEESLSKRLDELITDAISGELSKSLHTITTVRLNAPRRDDSQALVRPSGRFCLVPI